MIQQITKIKGLKIDFATNFFDLFLKDLSLVAVNKSGEYLGHCFGMDHHTSALEKVMDEPSVRNKLSDKINDTLDFVITAETNVVFKLYPPELYKEGGVAFETLYLATNRNLKHSENLKVFIILTVHFFNWYKAL